eukprot:Blabericola_migrator_1__4987@NODE_2592_length_2562_cov_294_162325_g1624_i0_p2_GENE_NODE_2592_length_2562_cov_294_162325_g1624_i0NODE_2592_length_2562_cov_294_162325_g1624_i0_p2_ORF_typecomplete_len242_score43_74PSD2/PF07624_11/0_19_NODE_2592_length_2562_cov_294_162325_g1624_i016992424
MDAWPPFDDQADVLCHSDKSCDAYNESLYATNEWPSSGGTLSDVPLNPLPVGVALFDHDGDVADGVTHFVAGVPCGVKVPIHKLLLDLVGHHQDFSVRDVSVLLSDVRTLRLAMRCLAQRLFQYAVSTHLHSDIEETAQTNEVIEADWHRIRNLLYEPLAQDLKHLVAEADTLPNKELPCTGVYYDHDAEAWMVTPTPSTYDEGYLPVWFFTTRDYTYTGALKLAICKRVSNHLTRHGLTL